MIKKIGILLLFLAVSIILCARDAEIEIYQLPYFFTGIYIDGNYVGESGGSFKVEPGKHKIEFKSKEENKKYYYQLMEVKVEIGEYIRIEKTSLKEMGTEEFYVQKWEESQDINYLINMKEYYPKSDKIKFINNQIKNSEKIYGKIREGEIVVQRGKYMMRRFLYDEAPVEAEISYDFLIAKKELSLKEYNDLMNIKYDLNDSKIFLPAQLKWIDGVKYCNTLSKKEGVSPAYDETTGDLIDKYGNKTIDISKVEGYRMPTEAEWEYAAIGGHIGNGWTEYYKFINNTDIEKLASKEKVTKSGEKVPDLLGLYDMLGNVSEWCNDWYDDTFFYKNKTYINSYNKKENEEKQKVCRGEYASEETNYLSVSIREKSNINESYGIGLRVVRGVIK